MSRRAKGRGYALALMATTATLGARLAFGFNAGDAPMMMIFLIPILLCAYLGGLGPGLLATMISAVLANYYLMPPLPTFYISGVNAVQWVAMIVIGTLVSLLMEPRHRARPGDETESGARLNLTQRKVQAGFAVSLVCLGVIGVVSYFSVVRLQRAGEQSRHTDETIFRLNSLIATVTDGETAQRGYTITGDENYLEPYTNAVGKIDVELRELRGFMSDNPEQQRQMDLLEPLVAERMASLRETIETRRRGGFLAAQRLVADGGGKQLQDHLRAIVTTMAETEQSLLREREARVRQSSLSTKMVILGGSVLAFGFVAVALFIIGRDFAGSRQADAALQQARDQLEVRVLQRTAELARTNQLLLENRARFETVVEHLSEGLIIADGEGNLLHWNPAALQMYGLDPPGAGVRQREDFARLFEVLTLEGVVLPPAQSPLSRVLRGEALRDLELKIRRKDRDWERIFSLTGGLAPGHGGPTLAFLTLNDITERKRADESRLRLAAIVNSSEDAIIGKTPEGIITSWNPGSEKMFGYAAQEVVGRPMTMLFPAERLGEETEILARLTRGESVKHFETVRVRKDGSRVDVSVTISPIVDPAGKIVGASKIARDITERKRAETRLRESQALYHSLVEQMPVGVFRKDSEGRYVFVNSWFCQLSAMRSEQYLGKNAREFAQSLARDPSATMDASRVIELAARGTEHHQTIMRTGGRLEIEEERLSTDGRKRYLHVTKGPVLGPDGTVVGSQGTLIDVTERKQAEEALRRLNTELEQRVDQRTAELERANKELESFSYSVSHDLRAPLRHVMGFVQLLQNDAAPVLSETNLRHLATISESARRMGNLIDDLLTFSRFNRAEVQTTKFPLDQLITEVRHQLSADTQGRNILWEIHPLPAVRADRVMLRQVLVNLLANAVKFTAPRVPAKIEIGCAPAANGETTIFVRDNGVGFDPQYGHKLFGVFQRLHSHSEFEGTGIGLANVQRIIHRHGGRTWAEGAVDAGATFYFSLPKPAAA